MQVVHLEILRYLSICNRYSNTAQALSEYLGQTKGSISQSLKLLEKEQLITRKPSQKDKRVVRIFLTTKGEKSLNRMSVYLMPKLDEQIDSAGAIQALLKQWQIINDHSGFGQCLSCRFNKNLGNEEFECGLTGEPLSDVEVKMICKEHEF